MGRSRPLVNIGKSNIKTYMLENIITCFGIPEMLVSDNGTQFKNQKVVEFYKKLRAIKSFSSVAYPNTKGHVEVFNKVTLEGLKRRLEDAKGK